jgi:hypothetical protein
MNDASDVDGQELFAVDLSSQQQRLEGVQQAQRHKVEGWVRRMTEHNEVPMLNQELGEHQRLTQRVPTSGQLDGTVITAGRRSATTFDGYALRTVAHVGVSAEGGVAESTMTLQSNGQAIVQSDQGSLFLLSTAPATLGSSSVTNVVGAGVVIAAGQGAPVAMIPFGGEADGPSAPSSVEAARDMGQEVSNTWSEWDSALESATGVRDSLRSAIDPDRATAYASPAMRETAKGVLADGNAAGERSADGAGGLVLHGEESFLIGTPGTGAIRAAESLTLSSGTLAAIAHEDAELVTGRHLSATVAENASVLVGKRVDLVAHGDVLHLASRMGERVEVQGSSLALGEIAPSDPQRPTDHVHVRSTKHVSIATDVDPSRAMRDDGIHLDSHDVIEARSAASVSAEAARTITLKIADKEIDIVIDQGGTIELRAKGAVLSLGDSDGMGFAHRGTELIRGKSDKVTVGTGPSDKLEIAPGAVALKGGSIKIG